MCYLNYSLEEVLNLSIDQFSAINKGLSTFLKNKYGKKEETTKSKEESEEYLTKLIKNGKNKL